MLPVAPALRLAYSTGGCGVLGRALRLSQELLPDRVRVLGPDHPDTLTTRSNIADWTEVLSVSTQDPGTATEGGQATNPDARPPQET